jgi:hypothetical protein
MRIDHQLGIKNIEVVNETKYILTQNDNFIMHELLWKKLSKLFTSTTFHLNKNIHIDFIDYDLGKIYICKNKIR